VPAGRFLLSGLPLTNKQAKPQNESSALTETTPDQEQPGKTASSDGSDTAYRVLARKYRPSTFKELLGQDAMVQTLTNAFKSNRIAQAYMLTGVRGVGKTTTARLIARALNYVKEGAQAGQSHPTTDFSEMGEHCEAIMQSRHVDVIEMDAASKTGIDDVREIIESVRYKPVSAPYKVYIIDEVHMLSKQAFNALLKTLEEPPEHVKFVFATTEIRKVPITVLSRCQRFDLRRFDTSLLIEHFANIAKQENVAIEDEALLLIARAAEGSARDGLSLLDQAIAYGGKEVKTQDVQNMLGLVDRGRVVDLFEAVMKGDIASALAEIRQQYNYGADPHTMLNDFAGFVHWVTRIKVVPESVQDAAFTEVERTRGKAFAEKLSMPVLTRAWQVALKGLGEVGTSPDAIMAAEMVFIRLAYMADMPTPGELVKKHSQSTARTGQIETPERAPAGVTNKTVNQAAGSPPVAGNTTAPVAVNNVLPMTAQIDQQSAVRAESFGEEAATFSNDAPPPSQHRFSSFQDVVDLVGKMRDIKLKTLLEQKVRPIRVSEGKIEIALEPGASQGLAGELSRKMEAWTGSRWMVLIAREGGEAPLQKQREEARDTVIGQARKHRVVQAVFEKFPDAQIIDVSDPSSDMNTMAADTLSETADEETD